MVLRRERIKALWVAFVYTHPFITALVCSQIRPPTLLHNVKELPNFSKYFIRKIYACQSHLGKQIINQRHDHGVQNELWGSLDCIFELPATVPLPRKLFCALEAFEITDRVARASIEHTTACRLCRNNEHCIPSIYFKVLSSPPTDSFCVVFQLTCSYAEISADIWYCETSRQTQQRTIQEKI